MIYLDLASLSGIVLVVLPRWNHIGRVLLFVWTEKCHHLTVKEIIFHEFQWLINLGWTIVSCRTTIGEVRRHHKNREMSEETQGRCARPIRTERMARQRQWFYREQRKKSRDMGEIVSTSCRSSCSERGGLPGVLLARWTRCVQQLMNWNVRLLRMRLWLSI